MSDTKIDRRKNVESYQKGKKPSPRSEYFGKSYGQLQRESKAAKSKALGKYMGRRSRARKSGAHVHYTESGEKESPMK